MIKVKREALLKAAERCAKVAPQKSTLDIARHVLIEAGTSLKYRATNLKHEVSGSIESSGTGRFTVDARAFLASVGSLSGEHVFIDPKDGFIRVTGDTKRQFKLPGLDPNDFPAAMDVRGETLELPGEQLADLLDSVAFAVCRDGIESRPWLGCVQLSGNGKRIRSAAVDGSAWCALREIENSTRIDLLVPVEIARLVADQADGNVRVTRGERAIAFDIGDVRYSASLIIGDFPPVDVMLEHYKPTTSFTVGSEAMLSATKAVQVVDGERDLGLRFGPEALAFECSGDGSARDEIDVACGPDLLQWFDGGRMIQALSSMPGEITVSYGPEALMPMFLDQPGRKVVFMPRRPEIGKKAK